MRVLVACEYSGRVRQAFRDRGHDAWSCDLLESDDGSAYHVQGDCVPVIQQGWDIIIMHPPCTALTVAGNSTYGEGKPKYSERLASVEWTVELWNLAIRHASVGVAMENPVGVLPRLGGASTGTVCSAVDVRAHGAEENRAMAAWLAASG